MGEVDTRARGTGRSNSTRCEGAQKRTETEVQIEKIKPLKDPTSHNPKKKDNISLVNVMRHKESWLTLGSRDTAEEVPGDSNSTRSGGSKLGQRKEELGKGDSDLILHDGQNKWFMISISRSSFFLSFFLLAEQSEMGRGEAERNEGSPT